ncbi:MULTISPECIES: hypothetical protein [unclassified Xanthobacter]|uniref:hypothetical protein n=1 Tax=unclassified Xanthobacter TaxID=2623496 RepID=UPI001F3A1696|nr:MULTISPECIES: hypothetical protein [unclassified Xanthobacter]
MTTTLTLAARVPGQAGVGALALLIEHADGTREEVTAPLTGSVELREAGFLAATYALSLVDPEQPTVLRATMRSVVNALGSMPWFPTSDLPIGVIEARHEFLVAAARFPALRVELAGSDEEAVADLLKAAASVARAASEERLTACGLASHLPTRKTARSHRKTARSHRKAA